MRNILFALLLGLASCGSNVNDLKYTSFNTDQNYEKLASCITRYVEENLGGSENVAVRRLSNPDEIRVTRVLNFSGEHFISSYVFTKIDNDNTNIRVGLQHWLYDRKYNNLFVPAATHCHVETRS